MARQDKYGAFFRYHVHSVANTLLTDINGFIRTLNNIMYWQTRSQS
jgi:hypothetical protein